MSINHKPFLLIAVVALASLVNSATGAQRGSLTDEQRRGQAIYLRGTDAAGRDIVATRAGSADELPAAYLACVSCHGRDGIGKPEGGITPSTIHWDALTRPYGATGAGGRSHPAYDEKLLKRAITMGIDSAGNSLHALMPRYRLSRQDADDLIAISKCSANSSTPA